ncbi:uncharacterized protein LOC128680650 [Plodia interpunctella]|uniref:uncharacterized protein LOC128680650 n=1 Tax=Plodia interpunctella TaxID=58824 RepID=UPI002367CC2C|nr:uncharacterized protein LOC128680650 [Plodia interpunctella]
MKLNLFKRSMIFATFFGSCLCIALIVASLGTTHWIDARAKRTSNPLESEGRISFGLFEGHKELNFGYGWRNHDFSVKAGNHPARRWAWCGTAAQLGAALASAAGACALAALGSAARSRCSPRPLLVGNSLAVLFTLGAISVWLTEYFLRLQHNVMSAEDLANTWASSGMADLGLSFWLVVGASVTAFVNDVCILIAMADGRDIDTIAPALEEKVNGAIMLY